MFGRHFSAAGNGWIVAYGERSLNRSGSSINTEGVTLDCGGDLIAPSPGTPGGARERVFCIRHKDPIPIPVPEYRARGPENNRHNHELHPQYGWDANRPGAR